MAGLVLVGRCSGTDLLEPTPPEMTPDEPRALTPPLSIVNVPVQFPLEPLVDLVEEAVPTQYGDLEELRASPDSGRAFVAYSFERSPFRARFVGDVARLGATVSYAMRMRYSLPLLPDVESSCGMGDDPRPKLSVALESPVSLDPDWSLRTRVRVAELRPATPEDADRCTVTMLGIDITDNVVRGARDYLEEHLDEIDALVAGADTRARFEKWWNTVREPVEIGDSIWLAMRPEGIRRGPVSGSGDSATVQLGLQSRPEIVIGARPEVRQTPLPPLTSGPVTPRLDLLVDARAEYSTASRLLTEHVGGQSLDMEGRVIRLDSIRVFGIGSGKLAMDVRVSGELEGRLYLTGRPVVDRNTGRVSVPDLQMDVATRDLVLSTASWFAARAFREYLRERATWSTAPAVDWLAEWLHRGLNMEISDNLSVTGTVGSIEIVGATAFKDALRVRLAAQGSASMFVRD